MDILKQNFWEKYVMIYFSDENKREQWMLSDIFNKIWKKWNLKLIEDKKE